MPTGGQRVAPIFTVSTSSPLGHHSSNNSNNTGSATTLNSSQQLLHAHQMTSTSGVAAGGGGGIVVGGGGVNPSSGQAIREEASATSVKNVHMLQLELRHSRRPPSKGPDHIKVLISGAVLALQGSLCLAGEVTNLCSPCTRLKLGIGLVNGFLDLFLALHCLLGHRLPGIGGSCAKSVLISSVASVFLNAASFILFYATAGWNLASCNSDVVAVLGVVVISNLCLGIPSAFLAGYITRHNAAMSGCGGGGGGGVVGEGGGPVSSGGYRGHRR